MKRKILTNTLYQLISKGVGVCFSLLLTIIITQNLGVYQFGELVKTISFVALFYTPLDFGINAVVLRLYAQKPKNIKNTINQLNLLRIVIATLLLLLVIIITFILPNNQIDGYTPLVKQSIIILSFTLYVQAVIRTTNSIFQHLLLYKYTLATELIQNLVVLLTTYLAINTTKNITPIITGYLIGGSLAALVQYFFARKFVKISIVKPDFIFIKQILISSLVLGVVTILSTIHTKTDILLLTSYRSTTEVGIYGLVKRIFEIFLTLPLFFSNSLYPVLVQKQNKKLLLQSTLFMFLTSVIIIVAVMFFSPLLMLIKPEFSEATPLLKQISLLLPLFFITSPLMWGLISKGQYRQLIPTYLQALVINLIICILLIPKHGAVGGIIGLAVSEFTTLLCLVYFSSKNYEHRNR